MPSFIPSIDYNQFLQWISDLYRAHGYVIVYLACALGNVFIIGFFLPGGILAALSAYFAQQGILNIFGVFLVIWAAMITGFTIDYGIGRFFLRGITVRWSESRLGRRFHLDARFQRASTLLDKHGDKAIFYAYATLGHFRSIVAVSLGIAKASYRRFLLYQIIASFFWTLIYTSLGYFVGVGSSNLGTASTRFGIIAGIVFLIIYIVYAIISALTGEFYDPLIGRFSFRRSGKRSSRPSLRESGPDSME